MWREERGQEWLAAADDPWRPAAQSVSGEGIGSDGVTNKLLVKESECVRVKVRESGRPKDAEGCPCVCTREGGWSSWVLFWQAKTQRGPVWWIRLSNTVRDSGRRACCSGG